MSESISAGAHRGHITLPAGATGTLLDDVSAWLSARGDCPAVRLEPADRRRLGAGEGTVARSTAAGLLGWLTGRTRDIQITTPHGSLPDTRWL
jgi:hypothetical protein